MISNKVKRGVIFLGIFLAVGYRLMAQQTSMLSHYFLNPYLYNPALAGQSAETRAFFLYRRQWVGIPGAPETQVFTIDGLLNDHPVGLGININNDVSNIVGRFSGMLSSSYTVSLTEDHDLSFGMSLGVIRNRLEFDKIRAEDLTDKALLQNMDNRTVLEGSAGLSYRFGKLRVGFVSDQLFNKSITYENSADFRQISFALVRHYMLTFQYDFWLNHDLKLTPLVLLRNAQGLPIQLEINTVFKYKDFLWANLNYRHQAGLGFSLGANIEESLIVGYTYEIPTSGLREISTGSHEFTIGIRILRGKQSHTSSRSINNKLVNELKKNSNVQYEKIDALQQANETLNRQLVEHKTIIERQNNEIDKLKEVVNSFDGELKKVIEELRVNLSVENSFDKASDYYLVVGAFRILPNAKIFQKVLKRETGLTTEIIQNDNQTWYFIYAAQLDSPRQGISKISELENSDVKNFIIGNPWVYRKNKPKD